MKRENLKKILFIILAIFILKLCMHDSTSTDNIYLLYSGNNVIKCNYINSRDESNGHINIVRLNGDAAGEWFLKSRVDSIVVKSESWWTCGPRGENIKYIGINTHQ